MKQSILAKKIIYFIAIIALILPIQCDDFIEVEDPNNQISQAMVFKDKATAYAALAEVYASLRSKTMLHGDITGIHFLTGSYTDELATVSNELGGFKNFYNLALQSNNSDIDALWINAYRQIYAVNNIIEGVEKSTTYLDEETRNILTGESLAIRGLLHLYLSGLFGEIPYVETTDYTSNQSISKSTLPEIYLKLKKDLVKAESLLNVNYPSGNKTRINKSAVQMLLARVYLYNKEYAKASEYAVLVITNNTYSLEANLSNVFLKDAKSTIWQFAPVTPGNNTLEGKYFIIPNTPPPYAFLTTNLVNSFESNDLRLTKWINKISDGQKTYYYAYKYKQHTSTATTLEYSVLLRIEEAYLIAAEAENELGNSNQALQKIKSLRTRVGLTTPSAASQSEIREIIIKERRHELFTESGHRFFDLKRWNILNSTMTTEKPSWKNNMKNWPLPQRELLVNPTLEPQNEGY